VRTIGLVTGSRADWGICAPIARAVLNDPELELYLLATGMHLSPEFGATVSAIEAEGVPVAERVEMLLSSDTPEGIAKSIGVGTLGFAQAFARRRPDLLVLVADRFEMLAAASAALPFRLPLAHVHGGESTEGAIDDAIRHAITKMAHLHFVATETYAARVRGMAEEAWRITVSGAPALDTLLALPPMSRAELRDRHGVSVADGTLLVTYHPVTLEHDRTEHQVRELLAALEQSGRPVIFTYPNADTSGRRIVTMIRAFADARPDTQVVVNLGTEGYASVMRHVGAMVGNSSSGLVEAASFQLPVVNVGSRQGGRVRARNVIDTGHAREEIAAAIARATSREFRATLAGLVNPYGDGKAVGRIVSRLREVPLDDRLLRKRVPAP
jgi:UDP-N-acetylglucosamine 2-epimerase (non-hydrolysing)/GDP/UDP-N,N'-diacetylbacillosamine 2-epimerase (hydrolysing)